MSANWTRIETENIPRSSHSISVIGDNGYIFGGEIEPRKPVGNDMTIIDLYTGESHIVTAKGDAPEPRVGHTAVTIDSDIYIFGGRGGPSMTPLEESGSLYKFSTTSQQWTRLTPSSPYPCSRSYHCSTSSPDAVFVHAGCGDASTGRLRDTWSYDVSQNAWTKLEDAPGDPRGGAAIVWHGGNLWRYGGFNGKTELGGEIDRLDLSSSMWETKLFELSGNSSEFNNTYPKNRSVSGLLSLGSKLVLLFGEGKPSPTGGHDSAGNFWGDVWAYDPSSASGGWSELQINGNEEGSEKPKERGWFACDGYKDGLVLWGGIDGENKRLGDGWILKV